MEEAWRKHGEMVQGRAHRPQRRLGPLDVLVGSVVDVVVSDGDPCQHGGAVRAPLDDEHSSAVRVRETPRERVCIGDLMDAESSRPWDFTAVRAGGPGRQQVIADGGQEQCAVLFRKLGQGMVKARGGPVLQR